MTQPTDNRVDAQAAVQADAQTDARAHLRSDAEATAQESAKESAEESAQSNAQAQHGIAVGIAGIGLLGPGLASWAAGQALLADPALWQRAPTVVPAPQRLPATERRRAGTVVKASIVVADEAVAAAGMDAALLPTVFTSSTGDPLNCHLLCEALAGPERLLSPTRFTNSVHNAPAGYWHIAAASRAPSTSLAAFDASFGAGLLEAAVQCRAANAPVLLVACDVPYPEPLHSVRAVADVFALALVLVPQVDQTSPALRVRAVAQTDDATATPCAQDGLEDLRRHIPAARALPLLLALAQAHGKAQGTAQGRSSGAAPSSVLLEGLPGLSLLVDVTAA